MNEKLRKAVEDATKRLAARTVIYCGTSLEEARTYYLRERPADYWHGHGNRARETTIEQFESEPEEIDSEETEDVKVY